MRTGNIFIFFLVLLLTRGVVAQPELKIIGRITSGNGLLTDGIKYTFKDSQGFMWFTFEKGFQRWDGMSVKNYSYITDTNINNSYRFCRPILEDKHGNFFIGTLHNGLIKLDRNTDTYTSYQRNPQNPEKGLLKNGVHEMFLDTNGLIWLTSFEGLMHFNPAEETFKHYVNNPEVEYDPCNVCRSVMRDSRRVLWVGTANGLYQLNEETGSLEPVLTDPALPANVNAFECMLEDKDGNMWFGTLWGIFVYYPDSGKWRHIDTGNPEKVDSKADANIECMVEYINDDRHEIWIGTQAGLKVFEIKKDRLTHFTPKNGYPAITNAGTVQYLFLDENNILWASMGGITLIDLNENPFDIYHLYSYPDSSYQTPAYSFYEDKKGDLWIGSRAEGLYHFDRKLNFIGNYLPCTWDPMKSNLRYNNMVDFIYEDPYGRIWLKSGPTELGIFDLEEKVFHPVDVATKDYYPHQLLIDPFDVIWIASHTGLYTGVMRDAYSIDTTLLRIPSLPLGPVDELLYDSQDRFWVLTRGSGIYCLTPENRDSLEFIRYLHQHYRHSFTIEYNARSMIEDDWGNIWFRSEKEIFRYDPELDSIVPEPYFNRNYNENIYSISRDKNGLLWLGIGVGLVTYNPDDTINYGLRKIDYRSGMPFTFVERASFFRDSRGYMYQGGSMTTKRGFFRFHPDSIPINSEIPPLVFSDFTVNHKEFSLDSNINYKKKISLEHNQNFFTLEFLILDYLGPEKARYEYMLEGIDKNWVLVGNRNYASYTAIDPGIYNFKVRGANSDGFWNYEGINLKISIAPPPWATWWAYTLYGLALVALFIAWRLYDLKRLRLKQALEIEHVESEKLKELDSMKSRFFANISHEFRTPLTLILGPLDKLIRKTEDPACVRDLNMMQRNAKRLQRLINQLLNLSKLEAGEMKLIAGQRNIVGLVRGYVHSFESLAKQKNIKLQFSADDEKTLIYVDNDKIEKILYNLLSNAFKFTPEGGEISVSVLTHPVKPYYKEGAEGGVNIIVADTGPGIPPDKVKRVFDRFYQAEDSGSGEIEGTGIGLSLVQELVKLHHGDIAVESTEGAGTKFIITLPKGYEHLKPEEIDEKTGKITIEDVVLPDLEPVETRERSEVVEKEGKAIVLVVEDNDDLRSYVSSYLDEEYTVHEAVDGEKGLRSAIEKVPDLVISDVMMPKMDGYRLCKELKSDERTSHIPVILLTAKAAKKDKLEGLGLGADDFLTKPFDPDELLVRIRNLIEQRRSLRQKYLYGLKLHPGSVADEEISMDRQFLVKARKVVQEHISDTEFNVETLGEKLAMSRMQLHRKITALTGQTAGEFIRNLRLLKAAELIRSRTATIAEIAYDTGFSSPSYFTDCFKKYFGKSPSEYQRSVEG